MPDSLGRYYVVEMEDRIRLLLDAFNKTLDANGNETASQITDFNVSNQDIDKQLNESLVALYAEGIMGHEDLFGYIEFIDITMTQLQYSFPTNMLQLRWMRYKPYNLTPIPQNIPESPVPAGAARPIDYIPMWEVYDQADLSMSEGYYKGPTWMRAGDSFLLGKYPDHDNPGGIMIYFIGLPKQLPITTAAMFATTPPAGVPNGNTAVIQAPFARLAQETIIYDAAYKLAHAKDKEVTPEVETQRTEWHQRFMVAIQNAEHQTSVNFVSGRLVGNDYAGRGVSIEKSGKTIMVQ